MTSKDNMDSERDYNWSYIQISQLRAVARFSLFYMEPQSLLNLDSTNIMISFKTGVQ